jgi:hypothetical protein
VRNRIEILAYIDVEHPIKTLGPQNVLQSAQRLVSRPSRPGEEGERGDVEPRLGFDLAVDFPFALDHDDRLQTRPLVVDLQPADVVENSDRPGLDAAVVAVDGRVPADRRILERNRLLLAGE